MAIRVATAFPTPLPLATQIINLPLATTFTPLITMSVRPTTTATKTMPLLRIVVVIIPPIPWLVVYVSTISWLVTNEIRVAPALIRLGPATTATPYLNGYSISNIFSKRAPPALAPALTTFAIVGISCSRRSVPAPPRYTLSTDPSRIQRGTRVVEGCRIELTNKIRADRFLLLNLAHSHQGDETRQKYTRSVKKATYRINALVAGPSHGPDSRDPDLGRDH